jgi:predicted PurR-regulated permease PerM
VQLFARPLGLFTLGIAIAASLAPLVHWLNRWLPRMVAIGLIYLVFFLIIAASGWAALPPFIGQIQSFSDHIPQFVSQAQEWLNRGASLQNGPMTSTLTSWLSSLGGVLITLPIAIARSIIQFLYSLSRCMR